MDSQSNALYDNPGFAKPCLSELSFNSHSKPKTPKPGNASPAKIAASPSGRRLIIVPSHSRTALEMSGSPYLSPSSSFIKKQHSIKGRLGR